VALVLMLLALHAPLPGLSQSGRWTLAIFGLAAVLWMTELVPLHVTAFIILAIQLVVLVPVLNAEGIPVQDQAFLSPFFSNVTLLFLGGLLLAAAASRHGLDSFLAGRLLRIAGNRPRRILLALMGASAFLSMWMSNTATTAMMLILAVALVKGLPPEASGFRKALYLGIPFSCNLGGLGTPIGTPPNAIAVSYLEGRGETVGFLAWMAATVPIVAVLVLFLWWLLLKSYAPPSDLRIEPRDATGAAFNHAFPSGWKARATLAIFVLSVLAWLTGGLTGLASGEVALLAAVALMALGLVDNRDFRGLAWDVLMLVGGGLTLGLAVELSGLSTWLAATFALDSLSPLALFAIFIAATGLMTTFMSNTATANMLIPLALVLPLEQAELAPLVIGVAAATSVSMALPVSTPPNAIAYYSGEVELRDMVGHGALISVVGVLLVWGAATTFWRLFDLAP
jgi:sodium-dependent dicarboxylate transporter 2/3/5